MSINSEAIGEYIGYDKKTQTELSRPSVPLTSTVSDKSDAVSTRDVTLSILKARHAQAVAANADDVDVHYKAVRAEEARRELVRERVMSVAAQLVGADRATALVGLKTLPTQWACYKESLNAFMSLCGRLDGYGMQFVNVFSNLCDAGVSPVAVHAAAKNSCGV